MLLIEDYRLVHKQYNNLLTDRDNLKMDIEDLDLNLDEERAHLEELENNRDNKDYPLIRESIRVMVNNLKTEMNNEQNALDQQIEILRTQYERELSDVALKVNESVKGGDILSDVFNRITELTPQIDEFHQHVLVDDVIESYAKMNQRSKDLKEELKEYKKLPPEKCIDLATKLSLRELLEGIENPKVKLGVLTGYICLGTILTMKLPIITLSALTGLTVVSLMDLSKKIKKQIELTADFERLKSSYYNNQDCYRQSYNQIMEEEQQKCADNYDRQLAGVKAQQEEVIDRYNKLIEDKENLINSDEFIASSMKVIYQAIEESKETINELLAEQEGNKTALRNLEKKLAEAKAKQESLRKQIEDKYMNNLEPGTERLLCKSLFLGFDEESNVLTLDFNCLTTLILYSGDNSEKVTSLIMMIFVQLLCNTSLASLSFYIFDTAVGASDFAIFRQGNLKEIIDISSTSNDAGNKIKELHEELQIRNIEILKKAENIEEYNKLMLSRNSLTKDYKIMLIQEASDVIFDNPDFEQICKTGDKVGIIPIIFLSHDKMQEGIMGKKEDVAKKYARILRAVPEKTYKYIVSNKSIIPYDTQNKNAIVQRLESIKGR
jgi:hypothetical protein